MQISTAAVQTLCEEEIPLTYFSTGGWFYGLTRGHTLKNVFTRIEQFRLAADPTGALAIARQFIYGKLVNQRTLLMRNHVEPPREVLRALKYFANAALTATHLNHLLGVERNAAAFYFGAFGGMLKPRTQPANGGENLDDTKQPMTEPREATFPFYPDARNRRPPRDHVTADLLAACDGWIQRFLSKASSNAPSSIARAARRLEAAILARCAAPQSDHPLSTQELLASLGDCERALATSAKWTAENYIPPIPPLSPKWITAAATDDTEFRLAASLASLGLWIDKQFFPIRRHLEAVKIGFGNPPWAAWDEDSSTEVVSSDGSATSLLIGIMRRRLLLAQRLGGTRWPEYARVTAWPSDIIDFIEGRIDESRFIRLLWGLCLVGFPLDDRSDDPHLPAPKTDMVPTEKRVPPAFYGQLKLCFASRLPGDREVPLSPSIFHLAASGDGERASDQALRRLHASSIPITHVRIAVSGKAAERTAAALLFPLWDSQLQQACQPIAPRLFEQPVYA